MNTKTFCSLLVAVSFCVVAPLHAQETAGEKASEAWDTTKKTTKKAAKEVASTTKKAVNKVENAVSKPAAAQQKIEVNVSTSAIDIPNTLSAGPMLFTIRNNTEKPHKIAFEGGSLKNVVVDLGPSRSGKAEVTMPAGTYKVHCAIKDHFGEPTARLTVK